MAHITNLKLANDSRVIRKVRVSVDNGVTWGLLYLGQAPRNLCMTRYEVVDEMYGRAVVKYILSYDNTDNFQITPDMITFSDFVRSSCSASVTSIENNIVTVTYTNSGCEDALSYGSYMNIDIPETEKYLSASLRIPQPIDILRGEEDPVMRSLTGSIEYRGHGYTDVRITPPSSDYDMTTATVHNNNAGIKSCTTSYAIVTIHLDGHYSDMTYPGETDYELTVRLPATKEHPAIEYKGWVWIYGYDTTSGGDDDLPLREISCKSCGDVYDYNQHYMCPSCGTVNLP